jgi:hypothetical protein
MAYTGKWQNNQQFDGGHSAVEVEVEVLLIPLLFKRVDFRIIFF